MRPVPASLRTELEREATPEAILGFLTITHPSLAEPIRVVSDVLDYFWGGHLFIGMIFGFVPLTDDDNAPTAQIRVQNTDRRIGQVLRSLPGRAKVQLDILSSADFDLSVDPREEKGTAVPIYGFAHFELVDATATAVDVTGRLMLRDPTQEPWPGVSATESRLPGLYR